MNKFKDSQTQRIFNGFTVKGFSPIILRRAVIKLTMVEAATAISELATPPSNHLEKLKGNRAGQWSIRVNDQYRICFKWHAGQAYEIEFTDYPVKPVSNISLGSDLSGFHIGNFLGYTILKNIIVIVFVI